MASYKKLLEWWPLFLAVLGLAAGAGALQIRVSQAEATACAVEEKANAMDSRLSRVEEAIGQLPEIRADIKELLRRG